MVPCFATPKGCNVEWEFGGHCTDDGFYMHQVPLATSDEPRIWVQSWVLCRQGHQSPAWNRLHKILIINSVNFFISHFFSNFHCFSSYWHTTPLATEFHYLCEHISSHKWYVRVIYRHNQHPLLNVQNITKTLQKLLSVGLFRLFPMELSVHTLIRRTRCLCGSLHIRNLHWSICHNWLNCSWLEPSARRLAKCHSHEKAVR